jgi:hypothetical protein
MLYVIYKSQASSVKYAYLKFIHDDFLAEVFHITGGHAKSLAKKLMKDVIGNVVVDTPHFLVCCVVRAFKVTFVLLSVSLDVLGYLGIIKVYAPLEWGLEISRSKLN